MASHKGKLRKSFGAGYVEKSYHARSTFRELNGKMPLESTNLSFAEYMWVVLKIVAGVFIEMTLRPPLRFLALFRVFLMFYLLDK